MKRCCLAFALLVGCSAPQPSRDVIVADATPLDEARSADVTIDQATDSGFIDRPVLICDGGVACSDRCVQTESDPSNCGGCAIRCPIPERGAAVCVRGQCSVACTEGTHPCGAACVQNDSIMSCGNRCSPCETPANFESTCLDYECGLRCPDGLGDCDGDRANGCEVELSSSALHCGRCGARCVASMGAIAECRASRCEQRCPVGSVASRGVCVSLAPPRLRAPLSTSTVSSRRPTLRWFGNDDADGALVELCRDRACTRVELTLTAIGSGARPVADLAPGWWYWRARTRVAATTGTEPSATWQFWVRARSADGDVDQSFGTAPDFNGDGRGDLVIGAPGGATRSGRVYVHYATATGFRSAADATLTGVYVNSMLGRSVTVAGDMNGDGFADLVLPQVFLDAAMATTSSGFALYLGGRTGLATTPIVFSSGSESALILAATAVGDVNGDGYADLALGAPFADPSRVVDAGIVMLVQGASAGFDLHAVRVLEGGGGADHFGASLSGADLDGDGYGDLIVGVPDADTAGGENSGAVAIFHGSVAGLSVAARTTLDGPLPYRRFGYEVRGVGDSNGDGYGDFTAVSAAANAVLWYRGSSAGVPAGATPVAFNMSDSFLQANTVVASGDINGDGVDDLALATWGTVAATYVQGAISVFVGGPSGISTTAVFTRGEGTGAEQWSMGSVSLGDSDGDLLPEFAVGSRALSGRVDSGRARVYRVSAAGISVAPIFDVEGPELDDQYGRTFAR